MYIYCTKTLIEKSRECHNNKPQPTPDIKRKRKRTKLTRTKQAIAREAHFPKRGDHNVKKKKKKKNFFFFFFFLTFSLVGVEIIY